MAEVIRKNLALLTLLAALMGAFLSVPFRDKIQHRERLAEDFLHDVENGTPVPVVIFAKEISDSYPQTDTPNPVFELNVGARPVLFIPDKYASAALSCGSGDPRFRQQLSEKGSTWFSGTFSSTSQLIPPVENPARQGTLTFRGSISQCDGKGVKHVLATGVTATVPVPSLTDGKIFTSTAWVTYPSFVGDLFIGFLLMIFVPTLILSILKAIVDSAGTEDGTIQLFRKTGRYIFVSTLVAALVGVGAGYIASRLTAINLEELSRVSLGAESHKAEYVSHPVLKQLGEIIPSNPLGALTNPDGTKGLQIAFTAILIGLLLSVVDVSTRNKISALLRRILALVVRDNDLQWKSLSDWAEVVTPFGIFFVSLTFSGALSHDILTDAVRIITIIFFALLAHALLLFAWIVWRRDWRTWCKDGLIPGIPGILTALATSSSYAALPGITAIPLMTNDSMKRGSFDLCTALNKNGTTIYISSVAAYILFRRTHASPEEVFLLLLLSGLASFATAGLPFAAVFGLRLVLLTTGAEAPLAWLILPIDPIIDRFVTAMNVVANLAACTDKRPPDGGSYWSSGSLVEASVGVER